MNKTLILSPHPDDGEIGAGGFIHHLRQQNGEMLWIVFSSCDESLPLGYEKGSAVREFESVVTGLVIPHKVYDFPVRRFSEHRQDILELLVDVKKTFNPTMVLCPSIGDMHQDHSIIAQESFRAFRGSTILGYEMLWNQTQTDFNYFVPLRKADIDAKCEMIDKYKSQTAKGKFNIDVVRSLALVRGAMIGRLSAEAFETIRVVR